MGLYLFLAKWTWSSVFAMIWLATMGFFWKEPLGPLITFGTFLLIAIGSSYFYLEAWLKDRKLWKEVKEKKE